MRRKPKKKWLPEHDTRLNELRAEGLPNDIIAYRMGFSCQQIYLKVKELGLELRRTGVIRGTRRNLERNQRIIQDRKKGASVEILMDKYGLGRMRIYQIIKTIRQNG